MKPNTFFSILYFPVIISLIVLSLFCSCKTSGAISAEEYFSIGMAYYEMGQKSTKDRERYFLEAEKWLNRARAADKTMTASDYNLGRIAFETGRYDEAARYFEQILKKDPENTMALKAASYSRIKNGDLKKAETHYDKILTLIPESADDGYNYALVLYGLQKYQQCEDVLNKYTYALEENTTSMLLFARAQKAQKKVEAIDSYSKWALIAKPASAQGLYEYALVLEDAGHYARAQEQYIAAISAFKTGEGDLKKSQLIFEQARLFLSFDPENGDGLIKLAAAVAEGFSNVEAIQELLLDERIKSENKGEIKKILDKMLSAEKEKDEKKEEGEEEKTDDTEYD